jgi:cytochrome c oxidase subunit 4
MAHDISDHYEQEPHDKSEPHAVHHVPYMMIFGALVVLTIITVLIGIFLRFSSEAVNVLLALFIASIKATLVALFFMHLKFEGKLIYLIFLVPLGLCVLLVIALLPDLLPMGDSSLQLFNVEEMLHPPHNPAPHH